MLIKDGIATVVGLGASKAGEVVFFYTKIKTKNGSFSFQYIRGLILSLNFTSAFIIILGNDVLLRSGTSVFRSFSLFNVNTSLQMFGRVIDALAQSKDGLDVSMPFFSIERYSYIEKKAAGIVDRVPVNIPLRTGVKAVDSLIPVGRGQRELIIGDRQTGKSSVAIDTILNYSLQNNNLISLTDKLILNDLRKVVWFVYTAIGQKQSSVSQVFSTLKTHSSSWFTSVVSATAAEPVPLQFLAPYTACTLGEFIRDILGGHCVIIYDDLSKHAVAYRQMSLLLRRPPGREAFPGDVFYVHSRLLERAGALRYISYTHKYKVNCTQSFHTNFSPLVCKAVETLFPLDFPRGTLTALPIIETQAGDVSAYIPTNVISITDGQIFLEAELFYRGIRPAINVGLSVSRVGSAAQSPLAKKVVGSLKIDLAQFREIEGFAKLGASLDDHTQRLLIKGENLIEILKQKLNAPLSLNDQNLSIFLGVGYSPSWLNAVLKISFFRNTSFISRSRIRTSWFELIRLYTVNFSLVNLSELLTAFLNFIKSTGVSQAFNFVSTEIITFKIINKFACFFFDDLFIAFLCENSTIDIKHNKELCLKNLKYSNLNLRKKLSANNIIRRPNFFREEKLSFSTLLYSPLFTLRELSIFEESNIDFFSIENISIEMVMLYFNLVFKYCASTSNTPFFYKLKNNFKSLYKVEKLGRILFEPFITTKNISNIAVFNSLKFLIVEQRLSTNLNFFSLFTRLNTFTPKSLSSKMVNTFFKPYFAEERNLNKKLLYYTLNIYRFFSLKGQIHYFNFIHTLVNLKKCSPKFTFQLAESEFQKFSSLTLFLTKNNLIKNSKFSTYKDFEIISLISQYTQSTLSFYDDLNLTYNLNHKPLMFRDLKRFYVFLKKLSTIGLKTLMSLGFVSVSLFFQDLLESPVLFNTKVQNPFIREQIKKLSSLVF